MNNNDNTIAVFTNQNKTKDTQPDFTGRVTIDGVNYRVALWKREKQETGLKYLAGKVELEQEFTAPPQDSPKPKPSNDDEIPF